MDRRPELHRKLESLLGSRNVYFQPPESVKLVYPCIIYTLGRIDIFHADDFGYASKRAYDVIVVSKDPDCPIIEELSTWPLCSFDRFYTADNLNHWTFRIYY